MRENEYSFEVKKLDKYIEYCKKNNYSLTENSKQIRTIYRNKNKTIARITIKEENNISKKFLDFKEDKLCNKTFISRKETLPIEINDDDAVNSILDFLGYIKDNTLIRERIVYKKNDVTFEIDKYTSPKKTYVVALEGNTKKTKKIFEDIKKIREE